MHQQQVQHLDTKWKALEEVMKIHVPIDEESDSGNNYSCTLFIFM